MNESLYIEKKIDMDVVTDHPEIVDFVTKDMFMQMIGEIYHRELFNNGIAFSFWVEKEKEYNGLDFDPLRSRTLIRRLEARPFSLHKMIELQEQLDSANRTIQYYRQQLSRESFQEEMIKKGDTGINC